ncbi:MAG: hypothetical protein C0392_14840 [Syntrophus sp. (in: bacteria)]|nr:hypothetical protein [Syntrophus sp. (in: bacteria)]
MTPLCPSGSIKKNEEYNNLKGTRREKPISQIAVEKCGFYLPDHARYDYLLNLYEDKEVDKAIKKAVEIMARMVKEKGCNIGKLVEYASLFPNATVRKRIGVVLEGLGIGKTTLTPLAESVEKTAVSPFTGSRKGTLNKTWRIIVDASPK